MISVKGRDTQVQQTETKVDNGKQKAKDKKDSLKNFKKMKLPLDKLKKVWYNTITKKRKGEIKMKLSIANAVRARYITGIMEYLAAQGEDVALIASNACNLPVVEDGEEGVLEVVVKAVKKPYDECMQEREDYKAKCADAEEKKAKREKDAAEKKAKAEAKRKVAEETAAAVLTRAAKAAEKGE